MPKSVFTNEYATFLRLLKETRREAGLTQTDLADRLGLTQSVVSKCERGERRIDVIELRAWCRAIGIRLGDFSEKLDRTLNRARGIR